MRLSWTIEDNDVSKLRAFYEKWEDAPIVRFGEKRNLDLPRPEITRERLALTTREWS